MRVKKPGFYDLAHRDYFADPCPKPSLTQSHVKLLLERSPKHAWYEHPRLNTDYKEEDDRTFDLGNTVHALIFGGGRELAVLPYADWRTHDARDARALAIKEGRIPVLGRVFEIAVLMKGA